MNEMKELQFNAGARYIIPTSDWGFKRLFATERNKGLLIGLLNRIIEDIEIKDLKYLDREVLLPLKHDHRVVRFDVYCECADGTHVIVEMQNYARKEFVDRTTVYTAASIIDSYIRNDDEGYQISRTYLVAITGNNVFPEIGHSPVRLAICDMDSDKTHVVGDKILQIFIELPKLASELKSLKADDIFLKKFAVAMRTMARSGERPAVMDDELLIGMYDAADTQKFDENDRNHYTKSIMNEFEYEATLYDYRREGKEEGRAEGRAEQKIEIATKMKAKGIDTEVIVSCTGLDEETVAKL